MVEVITNQEQASPIEQTPSSYSGIEDVDALLKIALKPGTPLRDIEEALNELERVNRLKAVFPSPLLRQCKGANTPAATAEVFRVGDRRGDCYQLRTGDNN